MYMENWIKTIVIKAYFREVFHEKFTKIGSGCNRSNISSKSSALVRLGATITIDTGNPIFNFVASIK